MRSRSHSKRRERPARNDELRPGDFPVGSLQSRAAARAALQPRVAFLMLIDGYELPLNLETSTCERRLWPNNQICEIVILDGPATAISQEELYKWIESHPILPG